MKNALDWTSRPFGAQLKDHVSTIVTAGGGGRKVQVYLIEILGLFGNTVVNEPEIAIAKGGERIAADGTTNDSSIEDLMRVRLANLLNTLEER